MRSICLLAIAFAAVLSAACLHASPELKVPQAFALKNNTTGKHPTILDGPGVTRVRPVIMDLGLFADTQVRELVEMNFFPNVKITVRWNPVEPVDPPSGFVRSGTVVGKPAGHAVMAISGQNVTATVTRGDGWIYEIRTTDDGIWVREIDQKKFPQERDPVAPNLR